MTDYTFNNVNAGGAPTEGPLPDAATAKLVAEATPAYKGLPPEAQAVLAAKIDERFQQIATGDANPLTRSELELGIYGLRGFAAVHDTAATQPPPAAAPSPYAQFLKESGVRLDDLHAFAEGMYPQLDRAKAHEKVFAEGDKLTADQVALLHGPGRAGIG